MKPCTLLATLVAAALLVPAAVWCNDMLIFSLAGLIPFFVDLKNGHLS